LVEAFKVEGFEATHWSRVWDPGAPDRQVLEWARRGRYVVFTHDLDYLLARGHLSDARDRAVVLGSTPPVILLHAFVVVHQL
jgi:predicted nuclease of predicted toxin-antitoxin system